MPLVDQLAGTPVGTRYREWTLRDDNHRHHHGEVPLSEDPLHLTLNWKATSNSQVHRVGSFRFHLRELLHAGYVRFDRGEETVRVRFVRQHDGRICLQSRSSAPALVIAPSPMAT
jgi:hypothetical protein